MEQITFNKISTEELKELLTKIISEEFKKFPNVTMHGNEVYGTRKQVAARLHISLPTLNELTKSGVLPGYRIQGRVLYKWQEVDQALNRIDTIKYKRGQ